MSRYTVWHYDEFLFEIDGSATREEIEKTAWEEYGISAGGIQIYEIPLVAHNQSVCTI